LGEEGGQDNQEKSLSVAGGLEEDHPASLVDDVLKSDGLLDLCILCMDEGVVPVSVGMVLLIPSQSWYRYVCTLTATHLD
jgi:hypothetical protein